MHRLDDLQSRGNSLRENHLHYRLKIQIEEAIAELALACCKSMNRALILYHSTSSECTTFIGSLVDRRIKLTNSLKYLCRQIPSVLVTDVSAFHVALFYLPNA